MYVWYIYGTSRMGTPVFPLPPPPLARYDLLMDTHPARAGELIAPSAAGQHHNKAKDRTPQGQRRSGLFLFRNESPSSTQRTGYRWGWKTSRVGVTLGRRGFELGRPYRKMRTQAPIKSAVWGSTIDQSHSRSLIAD